LALLDKLLVPWPPIEEGRSARGRRGRPLIVRVGLGSKRPFRARGRLSAGPVGDVVVLSFEARYTCASGEEAGTVFAEVCVSPANT